MTLWAKETGAGSPKGTSAKRKASLRTPLSGRFYYLLAAVGIFSLGNSSDMFLVLRAQDVGIGAKYAPLLGLVFNATYTAFSWPAGKLSDRIPRRLLVAGGYVVFAIVYYIFGSAPAKKAIWAAMALYGLYYAMTAPVLKAMVVRGSSERCERKSTGHLLLCQQRDGVIGQHRYWRVVEAFWCASSVLLFGWTGSFGGCAGR